MKVKLLHPDAKLPSKSHPNDGGWDLFCAEAAILHSSEVRLVKTAIGIAVPQGWVGLLRGRSGLGLQGIDPIEFAGSDHTTLLGGVIDSGYRGEVNVILKNLGSKIKEIKVGDRICQIIIIKIYDGEIEEVKDLDESERGSKGFGSTDVKKPDKGIPASLKYVDPATFIKD